MNMENTTYSLYNNWANPNQTKQKKTVYLPVVLIIAVEWVPDLYHGAQPPHWPIPTAKHINFLNLFNLLNILWKL